jgi:ParB family chromosome partitioning protein
MAAYRAAAAERAEREAEAAAEMARNEWYTPPNIIEAARAVMGGIDLDPASSPEANKIVGADRFFTVKDDGLKQPWSGRVWLNPPYGKHAPKFVVKFAREHPEPVTAACLLLAVHHMTTKWFSPLAKHRPVACLPDHRLHFSGSTVRPAHGSVVLGFGIDADIFKSEFGMFGQVWRLG